MVVFFKKGAANVIAVETDHRFSEGELEKLVWLFDGAKPLASTSVKGTFIGPRKEWLPRGQPMLSKSPRIWDSQA